MSKMIAAPAPLVATAPATVIADLAGGSWAGAAWLPRSARNPGVACGPGRAAIDGGVAGLTGAGGPELTRFSAGRLEAAGREPEASPLPAETGAKSRGAAVSVALTA